MLLGLAAYRASWWLKGASAPNRINRTLVDHQGKQVKKTPTNLRCFQTADKHLAWYWRGWYPTNQSWNQRLAMVETLSEKNIYPTSMQNIYTIVWGRSSIVGPILNQFWGLGSTWDHLGISKVKTYIPSRHFQGCLSPNRGAIGNPKITLGASKLPSELPMTSFGRDFVRACFTSASEL